MSSLNGRCRLTLSSWEEAMQVDKMLMLHQRHKAHPTCAEMQEVKGAACQAGHRRVGGPELVPEPVPALVLCVCQGPLLAAVASPAGMPACRSRAQAQASPD